MAAGKDLEVPPAVEEALESVAKSEGIAKPRCHVEIGSKPGDGYASILYRATIHGESDGGAQRELHLMCKTTLPSFGNLGKNVFVTECYVYQTLFPMFQEFADIKAPLPWPKVHYVSADPPCIVLEDLRVQGFVMHDRRVPLDESHIRLALQQVARLHGAGLALSRRRPDAFKEVAGKLMVMDFTLTPECKTMFSNFARGMREAPDLASGRFPPGSKVHSRIKKIFSALEEDWLSCLVPGMEPGFTTVHGDFHQNNMMFKYDKVTGAVQECKLYDFQTMRVACPALDLNTIMAAGTENLRRFYHNELHATLRSAGCSNPDNVYSWELFQEHYRRSCTWGLCFLPLAMQFMSHDEKRTKEFQDMMNDTVRQCESEGTGEVVDDKNRRSIIELQVTDAMKVRFTDTVQSLVDLDWLPSEEEMEERLRTCRRKY